MPTDDVLLREGLRRLFGPGTRLTDGCAVVEVRDTPAEVVLLVRCDRDPRLYGIPISLADTSRDFYYTDCPVETVEEWLESVGLGLMILLDTGFRIHARRTLVGDYIELREPGWPVDERFSYDVVKPGDPYSWERAPFIAECGLDPSTAVAARDDGRLIGWVTVSENNATGQPFLGQAVVSWAGETGAALELVEVTDGVPVTVLVDLAHLSGHVAGAAGAQTVTTDLDVDKLTVAGFRAGADGRRVLDTSFLDADPDAATELLKQALASPGRWGQDRDQRGRYLPAGRTRRWWHRLKYGRSGSLPRRYVG